MKVNAYAKINLTLDVTGRREDGYHLLDTIMQSISLCDTIEINRTSNRDVRLACDREYLPTDAKNTACHAAELFLSHCGLEGEGIEILLEKKIPSRAGMGGGSADAAAVLRGLNEMFEKNLTDEQLEVLGAKIGADVPFCVRGGTCRCTGIGEILQPVTTLPPCKIVVCKPPAGMSTPRAYALLDSYPLTHAYATPRMLSALESGDLRKIGASLGNRFDETMKLMQVKVIEKAMLSSGACGAMMTGSGSAVYGIFDDEAAAAACAALLADKGECFITEPK